MIKKLVGLFVVCAGAVFGQLPYYFSDSFTSINTSNWTKYEHLSSLVPSSSGLWGMGSLVHTSASAHEIKAVLSANASGVLYLNATTTGDTDSQTPTGDFYSVSYGNVSGSGGCSPLIEVNERLGGVSTTLASSWISVTCTSPITIRATIDYSANELNIWVKGAGTNEDNFLRVQPPDAISGLFGVGVSLSSGYTMQSVAFANKETVAPFNVTNLTGSALQTSVALQWTAATDDANGSGLTGYNIYRDGGWVGEVTGTSFTDYGVIPGVSYTYSVRGVDFHRNQASGTQLVVTTPNTLPPVISSSPSGSMGVHALGAYWGAGSEQIDMRTGNVNFTLPLFKVLGRNGGGVGFALSYNSQLWRKEGSTTWKLGADIGYGFGWRLMAGSITPIWADVNTFSHYLFTDSTGAQYKLDINNGGMWSSKSGARMIYDANAATLRFFDGSIWVMGAVPGGTEADAGLRYPTRMMDSNGNYVDIAYQMGAGASYANSSSRIASVTDVRGAGVTFSFGYTGGHLTQIVNNIGSGENFTFTYVGDTALWSPFSPQVAQGSTTLLTGFMKDSLSIGHAFEYNSMNAGELSRVIFPYGGDLRWEYRAFTYSNGHTLREVQYRKMTASSGGTPVTYTVARDDAGDAGRLTHAWATLDDAGGAARKKWFFDTGVASAFFGMATQFDEMALPSLNVLRRSVFGWTQNAGESPYMGSTVVTADVGQSYSVQSKTEQVVDGFGNVLQSKIFDFGNLVTAKRTYTHSYLGGVNYTSRNIRNRVVSTVLNEGGTDYTLMTNTYDGGSLTNRTGLKNHDSAAYGTGMIYRGNVTSTESLGKSSWAAYDITGMAIYSSSGSMSSSITPDGTNSVPTVLTVNGNSSSNTTLSWNSYLGVTGVEGPNGASATMGYDSASRVANEWSEVDNGVGYYTRHVYTNSPPTHFQQIYQQDGDTSGVWSKTTYDGFGRPIKVESGHGATTKSIVETQYAPCGCSPIGKIKQVSIPRAPGGTVYWTVFNYDALGRKISVVQPNSSGTTSYLYEGNTVKTTDPAGKWKKMTMDGLGRLTKVTEPQPTSGTWDTNYSYNHFDQMTQVSMPRGGNTQVRSFVYNGQGQMTSATNPETGTVTYAYNSEYLLASKTDAKNQKMEYFYDSMHRVTEVKRYPVAGGAEDACQNTKYFYDFNPFDPDPFGEDAFTINGWGRPTAVEYKLCNGGIDRTVREMLSYTTGGQVTKQRFRLIHGAVTGDLNAQYSWDWSSRLAAVTYPTQSGGIIASNQFDAMGRLNGMTVTEGGNTSTWVSNAQYGVRGEVTSLTWGSGSTTMTESRTYNVLGQMTRMTVENQSATKYTDIEYAFSATANNGRTTYSKDWMSGEQVNYTYDSLNRLITASTQGSGGWGNSYSYDGFGNLLTKAVTKGSAPTLSQSVDWATNRIIGQSYDANGNQKPQASGNWYDVENRLITWDNTTFYGYAADNKRVLKKTVSAEDYSLLGLNGQELGIYRWSGTTFTEQSRRVYFGEREISSPLTGGAGKVFDKLSSEVRDDTTVRRYYPWGEDRQNSTRFGTYLKDVESGLKYADKRYYNSSFGRFGTPDLSDQNISPANPTSWNRYTYVNGDPANAVDPTGEGMIFADLYYQYLSTGYYNPYFQVLGISFQILQSMPSPPFLQVFLPSGGSFQGPNVKFTSSGNSGIDKVRQGIYNTGNDKIFRAEILDCMAGLETGLTWNPNAQSGSHRGLYQINPSTWSDTRTVLPYSSNVNKVAESTGVAVIGLYRKLLIVGGQTNYQLWLNSGVVAPNFLTLAISAWESTAGGTAYGAAVLRCADYMRQGMFSKATEAIQGFLNFRKANPL